MKTLICPTCGCSIVRLGIKRAEATAYSHASKERYFCCEGCMEQFIIDPDRYLSETGDLIVCPVCLTEKPPNLATKLEFENKDLYFCRCPLCMDAFIKNPGYYIKRLAGEEDHPGTFQAACCAD